MKENIASQDLKTDVFERIEDCRKFWPDYKPDHLFIGYDFLEAAAQYSPDNITPYYSIISNGSGPIAFFAYEVNKINLYKSLENNLIKPQKGLYAKLKNKIRSFIAKRLTFKALVNGNSLTTGEYAYYIKPGIELNLCKCISENHDHMLKYVEGHGNKCLGVYIKDFFEDTYQDIKGLEQGYKYTHFKVQPNMIFQSHDSWRNAEDYAAALSSKYRVRNKRARKKAASLEIKNLSLEEIGKYNQAIFNAYKSIATQVEFNLFLLHERYFYGLKEKFGEGFQLIGYFIEHKLVGFYTYFIDHDLIEAHFLGCLHEPNRTYHIYHNFLLDLVEVVLKYRKKNLVLSRTALEIKSSLGAKPFEMYGFIKHRKGWGQWITPKVFNNMNPDINWVQRNPFKEK